MTDEARPPLETHEEFNFYEPGDLRVAEIVRARKVPIPGISPAGSMAPRYIAAFADNMLAFLVSGIIVTGITAKLVPSQWMALQAVAAVGGYLGYFFVFEALISMTPGKLATGVKVCAFDGSRCTPKQVLIRTSFRIIEVNPFTGGLIGALCIVFSRNRQRLGDMVAGTIVVLR